MEDLLAGLNEAQRSAVSSPASVLQVLAPPGSGKTKTLTARVAYLISHCGFKPWNIIVCTFTIKAARDMKERIRGLVGHGTEARLILGTFHSVARRFLVYYGHHIGIEKNFGIADTSDTMAIIKRIIKRRNYGAEPSVARSRISGLKARSVSCDQYAATTKQVEQQEFAAIYTEYEETLKGSNLLDYDDLLLRCVDLLRHSPECVSNIEAVLIDEFQDTNHVQYELMRLMAQKRSNITIVGDPDQSIYGFRSAEIKNLKTMQLHYPETTVVILEENYRSGGSILQSALQVIEQDQSRPAKTLLPTHCAGEIPVLRRLPSAAIEASWIVAEIQRSQALTGKLLNHSDFAILLRSAALSRHIESALGKAGIPYRMVGGLRFFDRIEVKLILDYLRIVNRPDHNDALVRIINTPSRKIGEVTIKALLEEAEEKKVTLWTLILGTAQGNRRPKTKLSAQAEKGIQAFVNIILTSQKKMSAAETGPCSLVDLISHVMKKLSFEEYLKKTHPEDFEGRWANVEELITQATDVSNMDQEDEERMEESLPQIEGVEQREVSAAEDALARFLANVALSTEVQQEEGATNKQVTISTIHAAKGLEWPVVLIPAAYEGSIPHSRAEDHDEERRLLYVGMTRAQSLLYLSCPVKNSQKEQTTISPFLSGKDIGNYFDKRGPSFVRYSTTQNLARILRRACPTEAECQKGRVLVERVEDDYYPIDGEESQPEGTISWDFFNKNKDNDHITEPHWKRRRVDDYVPASFTNTNISVTMNQTSTFSIGNASLPVSGFVSAGAHMREIQEAAETKAALRGEQKLAHELAIAQARDATAGAKKSGGGGGGAKRLAGQGSITSFFGRPTVKKPEITADEQVREAISFVREKKLKTQTATAGLGSGRRTPSAAPAPAPKPASEAVPLAEIENVRESVRMKGEQRPQPRPSRPALAPSLSSHKLRTAPWRPVRNRYEDGPAATKPYAFMSSSPPPDPDADADAHDDNEAEEPPYPATETIGTTTSPSQTRVDRPGTQPSPTISLLQTPPDDVQSASTLHATTMAQLSSTNATKRTLGVRRSVQGWGATNVNKPFTAPGRRR